MVRIHHSPMPQSGDCGECLLLTNKDVDMLVISRKKGERFRVGDAIITIVRLGKDVVRIGIQASKDTLILRDELVTDVTVCDERVKGVDKPLDDCELA